MNHIHKYESVSHHGISAKLMEFGIEAAEMRKCKKCGQQMPFLLTKKGDWVALFAEGETDQQDILLA
ncbi:MAG: hypothetical protein HZB31_08680 [Nitrospirae bacterium]|nr:hypothetical protein [Nitrospirota bacterium]